MIQVGCALIGALFTVLAYFAVPAQSLLVLAPVVLGIIVGFVLSHLWRPTSPARPPEVTQPTKSIDAIPASPKLQAEYGIATHTSAVGKRLEIDLLGRNISIVVHGLVEEQEAPVRADVEFTHGSGPLACGPQSKQIGAARFLLPAARGHLHLEETTAFQVERFKNRLAFLFLEVNHIDIHAKEVTFTLCCSRSLGSQ
jgi:hypothetical protein